MHAKAGATETTARSTSGELAFQVDSALLMQLGEQLVAKRSVAVAELIKNAYDADAASVVIEFKDIDKPGGTITILDDGEGIPFDRLQSTWMRIATTDKDRSPESPRFGRPRAGRKGIGRFATHRLARELELRTTAYIDPDSPHRGKQTTSVYFDWSRFEPGSEIQTQRVQYNVIPASDDTPTGTFLRLIGARDTWPADDIRTLRRDLVRLVSPLPAATRKRKGATDRDPGFDVMFEFPNSDLEELSGGLAEDVLQHAYATLVGKLNAKGQATYMLRFRDMTNTGEPITYTPDERFLNPGACSFTVHFFPFHSDFYSDTEFNITLIRGIGRDHGGVSIQYDNFRVPPYGDPGNDWLHLDYDRGRRIPTVPAELKEYAQGSRRDLLHLPGNNQLFGHLDLSRHRNPQITQVANREGLRENTDFDALRRFVRLGINWLTVMHARHSEERRKRKREAKQGEERSATGLLTRARDLIGNLPDDVTPEQRKEANQAIDLAVEAIEQLKADQIGELQMLRVLASTGTMIAAFDHQLLGILEGIKSTYRELEAFRSDLPLSAQAQFDEAMKSLEGWIEDAKHLGDVLGLMLGTNARLRKQRLAILPVLEELLAAFSKHLEEYTIEVDLSDVPAHVRTPPMFRCELSAIVINLITNAIKFVRPQSTRRIRAEAFRRQNVVYIRIYDTGTGADLDKSDEYFKPFYSESDPDPILGAGTGLGLKIVSDFVGVYGGAAQFIKPPAPWKTCIEVTLPED